MLDKETFKRTEGKLYGYFRDLKEMEALELECKDLQDQEESIQWDIKHSSESVIENEDEKEIKELKNELKYVNRKFRKNMSRIRWLKRNTAPLKKVLTVPPLSEEIMQFIIYKYKLNKSVGWIANEMYGGVRSTAYRWREDILEDIVKWEGVYGNS
ncbi:transcriptional regulator [Clostridium kluyveri]|uniref:Transcriptional regulator n=1 Tax=Clostridium kluyveri TaxID=1534 RepID=A0A1L5FBV9_CLOKL|nr:transcriptional regulator [Clostridium kluyveri]APM40494.1 transcriptional regulator [Clostridium kluyveri]APM40560.1 transcriptional regulator [Clostridium kluyveri]